MHGVGAGDSLLPYAGWYSLFSEEVRFSAGLAEKSAVSLAKEQLMVVDVAPVPSELAYQQAVLDAVEAAVTTEFIERLVYYTLRKISQRSWRGVWGGKIPGGLEAEDIVSSAIVAVLIGDPDKGGRRWDMQKDPDLMRFLFDVIDSKVSHLLDKSENRLERDPAPAQGETVSDYLDRKRDPRTVPEDTIHVTSDEEKANEQLFLALVEEVKDDPLLPRILECQLDGIWGRAEIAAKLGVDANAITQARKRLDRKLPEFRKKYSHMNPFRNL